MPNENIEIYLSIINDTLNNLQEDFDFLYDSTNKKPKVELQDRKDLLEEIERLKIDLEVSKREPIIKEDTELTLESKNDILELKNKIDDYKDETSKLKNQISSLTNQISEYKNQISEYKNQISEYKNQISAFKNEIIDLKGSIRVFLRIRKSDKADIEIQNGSINIPYNNKILKFSYDKIFTPEDSQVNVYHELSNIIESAYEGYKICIFAYGQTGIGKTYTMLGTKESPGIIFRTLEMIVMNYNIDIRIYLTCIEIYNEEVISIQEKTEIKNIKEAQEILKKSLQSRRTESTNCNSQSSRSHFVCTLNIDIQINNEVRQGTLCFIDLAGSERMNQSKVEGLRLKETLNINKSLSSLGDVFMAILRKDSHIPYRNSKLTYYLQEYLTGSSRVAMILNINGDSSMRNETVSTLRFGYKVSECKLGKIEKNVIKKI